METGPGINNKHDDERPQKVRLVLALGSAQTLGWGSTYYLPAILAVPMSADLGVTVSQIFAAFSTALVLTALMGPRIGRLIDANGGRRVLSLSSLLFAAGLVLLSQSSGPLMLWLAWLIIGLGMATGLYEAAFASLTAIYGARARSAITGITLMAGFASTICWPLTAAMEATIGWRGACQVWALAHLLIGLPLNWRMIPANRASYTSMPSNQPPRVPRNTLLMCLLAFVFAATWFTSTAMAAHLPRLLQEAGLSTAVAVGVAGLVGPAQVFARFLEFSFLQHYHPLLSARLAALTHPIGAALMMLIGAPVAALFTVLHGAGNGVLTIAKGTLPLALFGPQGYGARQGWLSMPARFVQAAAPFLFAALIDRYGVHALWLTLGLGVLVLLALMLIRPAVEAAN